MSEILISYGELPNSLNMFFIGRKFPDGEIDFDKDAIDVSIGVNTNSFSGEYTTIIWSHELLKLKRDLLSFSSNNVSVDFINREKSMRIKIDNNKYGRCDILITIGILFIDNEELCLKMEGDNYLINKILSQIDDVLKEYPVCCGST